MTYSSLNRKKIETNFSGGSITSNAGVMLLREVDRKLNLSKQLNECIADPRAQNQIDHSYESLLMQRIYGLACGYEDLNDQTTLRHDVCLQAACNQEKALGSASTLCRLENNTTREDCVKASQLLVELFIQKQGKKPPKELILDFDATHDPVHGDQEQCFYNGYYEQDCFLPLYVFCGSDLLVSYLRPSNIDGAKHSWAILSMLVKRFREAWPEVKITFRADSGFMRHRMFNWCEKNEVEYIVGIGKNKKLLCEIARFIPGIEEIYELTGKPYRYYVDFQYAAGSWSHQRRIIAKIECNKNGLTRRFIVTNKKGHNKTHYEQRYCMRGEMENMIKQQKLDLGADRTSCHRFVANQMRVLLCSFAYVLMLSLKELTLKRTKLKHLHMGSMREKFLKIGAVIIKNTRRIKIMMDSHYPLQDLFTQMIQKLTAG